MRGKTQTSRDDIICKCIRECERSEGSKFQDAETVDFPPIEKQREMLTFFKVFADATRLRILMALDHHELCVHNLCHLLSMEQSAISHQLIILRKAKLVKSRKIGKHSYYSLSDGHIKEIIETALEHISE